MQHTRHSEQMIMERVQHMIARGVIRDVDDSTKAQIAGLELENGYRPTKVEHLHPYGLSTHPRRGAEVIALALGGDRDHLVVLATPDRRYRIKVAAGEVALHDDQGQVVHLKRDGIELKSSLRVVIDSPDINLGGLNGKPVAVEGSIDSAGHPITGAMATRVKAV
jgi:phage baseplate assembly protein V